LPIGIESVLGKHLVCDLVYNPPETKFLKAAKKKGAQQLSGLGMLLYQGVIAFEIWTGRKAPVAVMKKSLAGQIGDLHHKRG
jgi:shikimate dehydrogenase